MARRSLLGGLIVSMACVAFCAGAVDLEQLKEEVKRVREELAAEDDPKINPVSNLEQVFCDKYGPNQAVTTRTGQLQIKGLLQVWYQHIDKAGHVNFIQAPGNNLSDSGPSFSEPANTYNSHTFRIRRTELHFSMTLNDYISAYVMMDPAREANVTFAPVPTYLNHNFAVDNFHTLDGSGQQAASNSPFRNNIQPQLLQDAYIEFYNCLPHHEFRIGQFKPPSGEESWRNSGQLDFVERAMVTGINNIRDIGVMTHGSWFMTDKKDFATGRLQYWAGVFNGPDGTVLSDPEIVEGGNRSDDNSDKDFAWRMLGHPLWDKKALSGRLEVGIARTDGYRGRASSGAAFDPALQINGIDRERIAINRQSAWLWYRPGGPVRGWWMRAEYGSGHDRFSTRFPTGALATGTGSSASTGVGFLPGTALPDASHGSWRVCIYRLRHRPIAFRRLPEKRRAPVQDSGRYRVRCSLGTIPECRDRKRGRSRPQNRFVLHDGDYPGHQLLFQSRLQQSPGELHYRERPQRAVPRPA